MILDWITVTLDGGGRATCLVEVGPIRSGVARGGRLLWVGGTRWRELVRVWSYAAERDVTDEVSAIGEEDIVRALLEEQ